jgi:hypothetical protein
MRRPRTRSSGAEASKTGRPRIIASGRSDDAAMNAPMRSAGCWPSESIVSACVKPAACAASSARRTAAPLPLLRGSTSTRRPLSAAAIVFSPSAVPSSLPSTTTQTGDHAARAERTVS